MTVTGRGSVRGIDEVAAPRETIDREGAVPFNITRRPSGEKKLGASGAGRFAAEVLANIHGAGHGRSPGGKQSIPQGAGEGGAKVVGASRREELDRSRAQIEITRCESDKHGKQDLLMNLHSGIKNLI
jgi:hypothetical protein